MTAIAEPGVDAASGLSGVPSSLVPSGRARISLVSEDMALPIDEGLKKFVYSLAPELGRVATLQLISTESGRRFPADVEHIPSDRLMLRPKLRRRLREFDPDVLIYVPRAAGTRNAFVRLAVLRFHVPRARTVLVSLQPRDYGPIAKVLIRGLRPHLVAGQGRQVRAQMESLGLNSLALPSGVDVDTFHPAEPAQKVRLRDKYGIPRTRFVVLHVGHLRAERNVGLLRELASDPEVHVVMVASTSMSPDRAVGAELRAAGVQVLDQYVDSVAELYQLADCYLFPVMISHGAIEMPLSVLEALACGTPVVSTPFGSLPDWLPAGPGLTYAPDDAGLLAAVRGLRSRPSPHRDDIRRVALPFSWEAIAGRLLQVVAPNLAPGADL